MKGGLGMLLRAASREPEVNLEDCKGFRSRLREKTPKNTTSTTRLIFRGQPTQLGTEMGSSVERRANQEEFRPSE